MGMVQEFAQVMLRFSVNFCLSLDSAQLAICNNRRFSFPFSGHGQCCRRVGEDADLAQVFLHGSEVEGSGIQQAFRGRQRAGVGQQGS